MSYPPSCFFVQDFTSHVNIYVFYHCSKQKSVIFETLTWSQGVCKLIFYLLSQVISFWHVKIFVQLCDRPKSYIYETRISFGLLQSHTWSKNLKFAKLWTIVLDFIICSAPCDILLMYIFRIVFTNLGTVFWQTGTMYSNCQIFKMAFNISTHSSCKASQCAVILLCIDHQHYSFQKNKNI